MSERPDWTECLYRPSMLCGEKLGRGTGTDMGEVMREMWLKDRPPSQPQDGHPEAEEGPPAEAPTPAPPPPAPEPTPTETMQIPIRHKGLLFSSFWQVVGDVYAGVGDVLVVKGPGDHVIIRRAPRSRFWMGDAHLRIAGVADRRLCIYGFILQRDVERIARQLHTGRFALVAACDPRAVVRPPRREELYQIWRYEGYAVNTAPARMALIRLDPTRKPKFAVDFLKEGCPIHGHLLNQILQLSGIPVQLTC
jgi:hypothetical protein